MLDRGNNSSAENEAVIPLHKYKGHMIPSDIFYRYKRDSLNKCFNPKSHILRSVTPKPPPPKFLNQDLNISAPSTPFLKLEANSFRDVRIYRRNKTPVDKKSDGVFYDLNISTDRSRRSNEESVASLSIKSHSSCSRHRKGEDLLSQASALLHKEKENTSNIMKQYRIRYMKNICQSMQEVKSKVTQRSLFSEAEKKQAFRDYKEVYNQIVVSTRSRNTQNKHIKIADNVLRIKNL